MRSAERALSRASDAGEVAMRRLRGRVLRSSMLSARIAILRSFGRSRLTARELTLFFLSSDSARRLISGACKATVRRIGTAVGRLDSKATGAAIKSASSSSCCSSTSGVNGPKARERGILGRGTSVAGGSGCANDAKGDALVELCRRAGGVMLTFDSK